jgi:hypothetical protein
MRAPMESIAIGEINQTVFDCPTCARPLALGARRCPGCGTHLVLGVPLAKASVLASLGLAVGIAVGGVIGFGVGLGRNAQAAPAAAVAAASSKAPSVGPSASAEASTSAPSPSPSQAPAPSADPTGGMPAISRSALLQAIAVDGRLRTGGVALRTALAARPFDASTVAEILRSMSADSVFGQQLAGRLAAWPGSAPLAQDLDALYGNVHDSATEALVASVRDDAAYRAAATAMVKVLGPLPALDATADALAAQVGLDPSASSVP